jgi:Asp-tRNA(Asn)/Glu-tRNA(Gln) amidotransferase A subunit family amidase
MDLTRVAHMVTIVAEMFTALEQHYVRDRGQFEHSVRINFALAGQLTPSDYVRAQQVRTRAAEILEKLYEDVDVIVTPTTGCTAPELRPEALTKGESDLATLSKIMRFIYHANLVGLPASSVPTGYDRAGLPVGLHLMGRAWEEALLMRLARVLESAIERRKPRVHFDLLG